METQLKEKVDLANLKKIEDYLETTSKHLFLTEDGKFFKAFSVKIKDKLYCITLNFDGVESNNVTIIDVERYIPRYGNNTKNVISHFLFPPHVNRRTSISSFKAMKEKVNEIKKFIEEKFDGKNIEIIVNEIKKMLVGLTVKKEGD
jgi:hypothetical protein